jgi:glucose 1-dehydrogenase
MQQTTYLPIRGQKALVTGANSGIGKGVALALGRAGADVVVNYVAGEEAAQHMVEEIRRSDRQAYAHQADVGQEEQVTAMFQRMYDTLAPSIFSLTMPGCNATPHSRR